MKKCWNEPANLSSLHCAHRDGNRGGKISFGSHHVGYRDGAKLLENMKVMILEDNENEIALLQDAVARCGVTDPIYFVRDSQGVIDYLLGKERFADRVNYPLPDLLLLDLNLPHASGMEVLRWFKEHPEHRIPTLVLTSSSDEKEIAEAYDLAANSYFVRPKFHSQLCALMKIIYDYWSVAKIPGRPKIS